MTPAPEPPIALNAHARTFWDKHYVRLEEAQVLTPADVDSFALLCIVWGRIQQLESVDFDPTDFRAPIQLDRLLKQYHAYAKQFGLLPQARKQSKMEVNPPQQKDEFGL